MTATELTAPAAKRELVAATIARAQDADYWVEEIRAWEAKEQWERDAYPGEYPGMAYEDRDHFLRAADAVLDALAEQQAAAAQESDAVASAGRRQALPLPVLAIDFNSPRFTTLESPSLVDEFRRGNIAIGDTVIGWVAEEDSDDEGWGLPLRVVNHGDRTQAGEPMDCYWVRLEPVLDVATNGDGDRILLNWSAASSLDGVDEFPPMTDPEPIRVEDLPFMRNRDTTSPPSGDNS
ncbi:hypothetical protein [Curtobacterium sp. MCBD17_040]|uniref:hypothetical protein n=1 Tax=Curtobacterium sp. MCBD17_040 TaxID=2175674 RepID=UPI000DA94C0A|nr:hypothetical protein [Curtobacterium sp. MCBD17_040]WIB65808.1 hypothetical protein DEI94_16980 [Curtobacterium sp. MCBD17_040]